MVTLAILLYLKTIHNFNIYTETIDYGLRKESNDETRFLIDYAKFYGIVYNVSYITDVSRKKENSGTRTDFEERSRDIRFNAYKEIIETIYKNNGSQYINNRFNGHWCLKGDDNYIACV
jgi:tRNA(Ile)-lysidine synthase TilS/MesJ